MPSALRAQVALIGLLAVLLIPIATSSLRGLTHILTCKEESAAPFTLVVPADGPPEITSSSSFTREEAEAAQVGELCGGLTLDLRMGSSEAERALVTIAITNNSDYGWRGSVHLRLDDTTIPIDIGQIDAGETATDDVELRVDSGETYDVAGSLLVGP